MGRISFFMIIISGEKGFWDWGWEQVALFYCIFIVYFLSKKDLKHI